MFFLYIKKSVIHNGNSNKNYHMKAMCGTLEVFGKNTLNKILIRKNISVQLFWWSEMIQYFFYLYNKEYSIWSNRFFFIFLLDLIKNTKNLEYFMEDIKKASFNKIVFFLLQYIYIILKI